MKAEKSMFDKAMSLRLKGTAIVMMLMHHSFLWPEWFNGYSVSLFPFSEHTIISLAELCKICVSIFAFISGYGLFLNYRDNTESAQRWVAKRYIKTFSGFWFVWIVSCILLEIKHHRFSEILIGEDIYKGIIYSVLNFLGLSNLFVTPTPDTRWWYMSAALLFIFLTPLVFRFQDELGMLLVGEILFIRVVFVQQDNSVLLGMRAVYAFITPYLLGCIFARYNLVDHWLTFGNRSLLSKVYKFLVELWIIIFLCKIYNHTSKELFWDLNYGILPTVIILFLVEYILRVPALRDILLFIGIHSANIYYTHSFIIYYRPEIIYRKHFVVTILIWMTISLALSIIIEMAKKLIRYDNIINHIQHEIVNWIPNSRL